MIVASQAEARSIKAFIGAELTTFNFQAGSMHSRNEVTGGYVAIGVYAEKNITLRVDFKSNCPPGAMCIAMMPIPLEVTVPVQSVTVGSCGETIYEGLVDQRPVDGIMQKLTVVDHRTDTCKYFIAVPPTEVTLERRGYNRLQGGETFELHTFTGVRLN